MSRRFTMILAAMALALSAVCSLPHPALAAASPIAGPNPKSWTADNGNGTYSNPLFYEEFEDPDIIRVGEDYYLAGTTMHMNPGLMIMHSRDLVNWELSSYCIDKLDLGPDFRLEGGRGVYGRGIWAPCIRYHDGMFYVFSNVNGVGLQLFRSQSPKGPWAHNQLPYFHDLSVLFDDDGKTYLVSGNHNPYPIVELNKDCTAVVPGVSHPMNAPGMGEGHHLYKINGKYYDISAIPGGTVDQMVARADSIDGPWAVERMVQLESLGVPTRAPRRGSGPGANDRGLTLHQGGICDTPSGQWWSVIMQDHGSIGRMVALAPVTWENGFPFIGLPGNLRKAPNTWIKPNTGVKQEPKPAFLHDDDFGGPKFKASWQWNHVPDDSKWSLTEKPGVLRLHSLPAADFYAARNTLCQRPLGPECVITVELDITNLVTSDTAGLALLSAPYAWIGVVKTAAGPKLQMVDNTGNSSGRRGGFGKGKRGARPGNAGPTAPATPTVRRVTTSPTVPPHHLWLRVACNFDTDDAIFSWSADGRNFTPLGNPFTMTFQLTTFQGVRPGLFHFSTSGRPGGYADFDNFTMAAPRVAGIEREIPLGQTIVLTSGADGSTLAADTQKNALVNLAADASGAVPQNAMFKVVDLGLGRVALQAASGKMVSAGESAVALKDLAGAKPGDAESFQWVNLMRGDTMLMTLTNHRYLAITPNTPGPVTVSATGPRPDRKSGAEFKWKAVD